MRRAHSARTAFCTTASLVAALLPALLSCTEESNPFDNPTHARATVLTTAGWLADGDSLPMYSTRSLVVGVLVSEQVDSFRVSVDNNRHFADTVVRSPTSQDYAFPLSFVDTGLQEAVVRTYRTGGDRATETVSLHSLLTIGQNDIEVELGREATFTTAAEVEDSVFYHWEYGDDIVTAATRLTSRNGTISRTPKAVGRIPGRLWVSLDSAGLQFPSPCDSFHITVMDADAPTVVNLTVDTDADTMVTGDNSLVFLLLVTDTGSQPSVYIDSQHVRPYSRDVYRTVYTDLSTAPDSTRPIEVRAVDASGNVTRRTFTLIYSAGAPSLQQTRIFLTIPDTVTDSSEFLILGTVRDFTHSELLMTATNNGLPVNDTDRVVLIDHEAEFGVWVHLDNAVNNVVLSARDVVGNSLATAYVTILKSPAFVDTTGPSFQNVSVDNQPAYENALVLTGSDSAALVITAADPSTIAWLRVGNDTVAPVDDRGFMWRTPLTNIPSDRPLTVVVTAADAKGNQSSYRFLVQRDMVPQMPVGWQWVDKLKVGELTRLEFNVVDESDSVTVTLHGEPAGMVLRELSGINHFDITWTPTTADTGVDSVTVVLDDGDRDTAIQWRFNVLADQTVPVALTVMPTQLPTYLQVDVDAFDATLNASGGAAPYRFVVRDQDRSRVLLDSTVTESAAGLSWTPGVLDTGVWNLNMAVFDSPDSAVLSHTLTVVPRNSHPCALELTLPPGADTTAQGDLDLRSAVAPQTLTYAITDADHPFTERYVRTIIRGGITTVDTLDSARTFTIVVDTVGGSAYETIRVVVSDLTGTNDTAAIGVVYASSGPRLSDLHLLPSRFFVGAEHRLPFAVIDPDRPVSVDMQGAPSGMTLLDTAAVNTWILRWTPQAGDIGQHAVTLTLDNGLQDTIIDWRFAVLADSSSLVRLDTAGSVPGYLEAGKTLALDLMPVSGTGAAPLRYRVVKTGSGGLLLDTVMQDSSFVALRWIPEVGDTGLDILTMSVHDARGDSDTLRVPVLVVPPNGDSLHLSVELPGSVDTTVLGDIDMRTATGPVTVMVVIHDSDHHLTERYDVRITRRGVTTVQTLDSASTLHINLDTVGTNALEEIVVIVSDRTGATDTAIVRAVYSQTPPRVDDGWVWPKRFIVGTVYADTLDVLAYAGGPSLSVSNQPGDLGFTQSGPVGRYVMHYAPVSGDTGQHTVSVTLSDAGGSDTTLQWRFDVLASAAQLVAFGTAVGELSSKAAVGAPVTVSLRVDPATGKPPFRYVARPAGGGSVLLDSTIADYTPVGFSWTPGPGDEGPHTFTYVVTDVYGDTDTLAHAFTVYPENRNPCWLTYTLPPGADTLSNGHIHMPAGSAPVQVAYLIHDLDDPATEHYRVTITDVNGTTSIDLGTNKEFDVAIDPAGREGYDTTIVVVHDSTGTTDTVRLVSVHEMPLPSGLGDGRFEVHLEGLASAMEILDAGPDLVVTEWRDADGPFSFVMNVHGNPPYLDSTGFGGRFLLVDFERYFRDNLLAENSHTAWSWTDSAFTVFVVARLEGMSTDSQYTLLSARLNETQYVAMGVTGGEAGAFTSLGASNSGLAVSKDTWYIFTYRCPQGAQVSTYDMDVWLNGARGAQLAVSMSGAPQSTMLGAVGRNTLLHNWDGPMVELLMYRGALSDTDIRTVQQYLGARYGIALD
ncbi:MAG: hypothetical protein GF331_14235 [Chitinivibrionales bacterium]|nr:hypothetical protein [Chitinivibrionales bacterium]